MTLHLQHVHTPFWDRLEHWFRQTGGWVMLALFVGLAIGSGWKNTAALDGQAGYFHKACRAAVVHEQAVDRKILLAHISPRE